MPSNPGNLFKARTFSTASLFALTLALPQFTPVAQAQSAADATSEVLDDVRIPGEDGRGNEINQVSGLAWDSDEGVVYAVSDYGHIIHLKINLANDKIASVDPVYFGPLQDAVGDQTFTDAEDIVVLNGANGIKGDSQIAVVFEDGPSAATFTPQGKFIAQIELPAPLKDRNAYDGDNQRLESIAVTSDHGFLFAPQVPLVGQDLRIHTVYAADGVTWQFDAQGPKHTSTKAMQTLPDGSLMLLEGVNPGGLMSLIEGGARELHLRQLNIALCKDGGTCQVQDFSPIDAAPMQDRYEGLTQVGDNLFLLATDENSGSRLILVRTKP